MGTATPTSNGCSPTSRLSACVPSVCSAFASLMSPQKANDSGKLTDPFYEALDGVLTELRTMTMVRYLSLGPAIVLMLLFSG